MPERFCSEVCWSSARVTRAILNAMALWDLYEDTIYEDHSEVEASRIPLTTTPLRSRLSEMSSMTDIIQLLAISFAIM